MTTVVDGTQLYNEAIERIQQLEKLNATLAAEVDRQRPVVEAACDWARNDKGLLRIRLRTAVINYERSKSRTGEEDDLGRKA